MHVDDMADATIFLMNLNEEKYNKFMNNYINHINIGTGIECSISKLVYKIAEIVGYRGQIEFDQTISRVHQAKVITIKTVITSSFDIRTSRLTIKLPIF